ncbi:MAG: hypothetical protein CVU38_19720 [Chloroflexi bacterium HGW-Chloroflexi-1]|nr:MAG: hypothetical protein CVU38_19720 [Chloroflexi bacterium HGW-Chloroflexi-1]
MRIAVLGTGALGCVFAARLAGQAEVWMLGTWAEGVAAVQRDGVRVHEMDGATWQARVNAAVDPAQVPSADVALLLVKSYQTDRAAAWAAQVLAPAGFAVTLQNGLDNGPRLAAAVGAARAAVGVTFEGATLLGPGQVRHAGRGPIHIGARPEVAGRVAAFVDLLRRAGFAAEVVSGGAAEENVILSGSERRDPLHGQDSEESPQHGRDSSLESRCGAPWAADPLRVTAQQTAIAKSAIDGILWGKAVVNAAINPLTALWRVPNGELLASADRRALLAALAKEAAAVAVARGVVLPYPDPVARVEEVCRATAANHSSMLQDVERGRPTEIDSINGVIVAEGRRLGAPTPVNETVWRLVRGSG